MKMRTQYSDLMYDALSQLLQHMGNDPCVFCLKYTCKHFYQYFLRRKDYMYGGFDKYSYYGFDWILPLESIQRKRKMQPFFAKIFEGYVICDFEPLYSFFMVEKFGYFQIPLNITKYFYVLKCDGLKNMKDISLYSVRKLKFHVKSNIVSLNEPTVIIDPDNVECKMSVCVHENYELHNDSFVVGVKISLHGVLLTSCFVLGKMNYFGVTCYSSFKLWIKTVKDYNMTLLKCYFCYTPFMNKIMAMFQCKKCCKVLPRFFEKFFRKKRKDHLYITNFENFEHVMKFNTKRSKKVINMNISFTSKYSYMNASNLPKIFDHLCNGELIHDCYYDIENSNKKIVFINDMHYIK